jgi:glycosyltransferase involved in cell wall biosynthesis
MALGVTVVIPAYKAAAWVEATLESVVRQTHPHEHLEIIVVDDASPDDGAAIAGKFLERHSIKSRVVACEKNGGVSAARNVGWKLASGDWIQFLDADDLLARHKLESQAQRAAGAREGVAVVYSNWRHFALEDGTWQPSGPLVAPFVDDDPVLQILQDFNFGYVGPTLVRKSSLARVGGFDEKPNLGEDCDLMLRLAMAGGQFRKTLSTEAAFFYRQTPNSLWTASIKNVQAMRNLLYGFRDVEIFLRKQSPNGEPSDAARAALARRYSRFVDRYADSDPETFRSIMSWLRGLGLKYPPGLNPRLRALSMAIGYENATRLRSAYRRLRA